MFFFIISVTISEILHSSWKKKNVASSHEKVVWCRSQQNVIKRHIVTSRGSHLIKIRDYRILANVREERKSGKECIRNFDQYL